MKTVQNSKLNQFLQKRQNQLMRKPSARYRIATRRREKGAGTLEFQLCQTTQNGVAFSDLNFYYDHLNYLLLTYRY